MDNSDDSGRTKSKDHHRAGIVKRITQREGSDKLGISERHFRRLLLRHRQQGDEGLVAGLPAFPKMVHSGSRHTLKKWREYQALLPIAY